MEKILTQMDYAAGSFRSVQASLLSEQYQKVVDETDVQKGEIYIRREGKDLHMMLAIREPEMKYVLLKEGKVRLYQPKIDQVTEYSVGKNRDDVEAMFALGFGGRGHDLLRSFEVKLAGSESMEGVTCSKLELIPRGNRLHNMFARITLWVDAARGISLKQQFQEPGGDYRTAHYSDIKLNASLGDQVFELHTTGKTKVVTPQAQ